MVQILDTQWLNGLGFARGNCFPFLLNNPYLGVLIKNF